MLPTSPLVVAEQFGRWRHCTRGGSTSDWTCSGTDQVTVRALRRTPEMHATPSRRRRGADQLPPSRRRCAKHPSANPGRGYLPRCGSSARPSSARSCGAPGLPFSFAYHFAPTLLDAALTLPLELPSLRAPRRARVMVAVSVLCAPSEGRRSGSRLDRAQHPAVAIGPPRPLPSPEEAARYQFTVARSRSSRTPWRRI